MKLLFFSDLHGCSQAFEALDLQIKALNPDILVMLGDALYHGPRNPLRADYAPPKVVDMLNGYKDKIIAIRGNCDSEVDQMLLEFPIMAEYSQLMVNKQRFFLTHGHHWSPDKLPALPTGSLFCYGHTHVPHLERLENGIVVFNPGSISLPKGGSVASFGLFEDGVVSLLTLSNGEVLQQFIL